MSALAPAGVRVGVRSIDRADLAMIRPVEAAAVAGAVPRRQHEFASGRVLLRRLLDDPAAIPVGPTRAPVLPPGMVGSLAHDRRFAVAAVGRDAEFRSIGVDVEPLDPLSQDMSAAILRPDEAGLDAHLAFSLKEAAYKAWSTLGGRILDHHDVRVRVHDARFSAEVVTDGLIMDGNFSIIDGRCVALVCVGPP